MPKIRRKERRCAFFVTPGPKEGSGGRSKSDRQLDRQPAVVTSTNAYISKWLQHYKRILGFRNTILVSLLCFIRDSRSTCGSGALFTMNLASSIPQDFFCFRVRTRALLEPLHWRLFGLCSSCRHAHGPTNKTGTIQSRWGPSRKPSLVCLPPYSDFR